jgi:hypothetical protein
MSDTRHRFERVAPSPGFLARPKAAKGPAAPLSLSAMTRRLCARCGDREALFAGTRCCSCGADTASKTKVRRTRFNGEPSVPLRTPIADGENIVALMKAKP